MFKFMSGFLLGGLVAGVGLVLTIASASPENFRTALHEMIDNEL